MTEKATSVKHDGIVNAFHELGRDMFEPVVYIDAVGRTFNPNDGIGLYDVRCAIAQIQTNGVLLHARRCSLNLGLALGRDT